MPCVPGCNNGIDGPGLGWDDGMGQSVRAGGILGPRASCYASAGGNEPSGQAPVANDQSSRREQQAPGHAFSFATGR